MTIFAAQLGAFTPHRQLLTNTTTVTILSASGRGAISLGKIRVVNITGGAVTVTLDFYDGTTAMPFWTGKSVPANDAIEVYDEIIPAGHILRGGAGANTSLWIHILRSA